MNSRAGAVAFDSLERRLLRSIGAALQVFDLSRFLAPNKFPLPQKALQESLQATAGGPHALSVIDLGS